MYHCFVFLQLLKLRLQSQFCYITGPYFSTSCYLRFVFTLVCTQPSHLPLSITFLNSLHATHSSLLDTMSIYKTLLISLAALDKTKRRNEKERKHQRKKNRIRRERDRYRKTKRMREETQAQRQSKNKRKRERERQGEIIVDRKREK